MKKILAILLAMMLILVNVAAFAEEPATEEPAAEGGDAVNIVVDQELGTTPVSFTLTKTYTVTGDTAINPADELTFTVSNCTRTESSDDFDDQEKYPITIENVAVDEAAEEAEITVGLPSYDLAGVYSYTIDEDDTNKAGVEYLADTLYLVITVITNQETSELEIAGIAVHKGSEDGDKIDEFENKYTAGSLVVSKEVTGKLGDRTKDFEFTVTFTAPTTGEEQDVVNADITITYPDGQDALTTPPETIAKGWTGTAEATFTLKHDQSVTFNNIPKGVTYEVVEADVSDLGYTTTPSGETGTIDSDELEAAFVNDKDWTPDTGIELETLPFVLLMGIALAGAVMSIRRREDY